MNEVAPPVNQTGEEIDRRTTCPEKNRTNTTSTSFVKNSLVRERQEFRRDAEASADYAIWLVRSGAAVTPGQINQIFWKSWLWPRDVKARFWAELATTIDHMTFKELRSMYNEYVQEKVQYLNARNRRGVRR